MANDSPGLVGEEESCRCTVDEPFAHPTSTTANTDMSPARRGGAGSTSAVPTNASRRRKMHVGHFAFMRAIVQGVEARLAWERYLKSEGDSGDQRLIRATIAWIRTEFSAAAQREEQHATARLVRMEVNKFEVPSMPLPTLEVFAEEHGLQDESQAEQIAAFEAAHGKRTQILKRRGRLVDRQLEALRWLEDLLAQPPRAGDAVASWLDPGLASHLEAGGILTVAQLIERINGIGQRWYGGLKSLGAAKAARIVAWCKAHQPTIGLALGRHIEQPRLKLFSHELAAVVEPSTDIRPLEKFLVPMAFDGRLGAYRRPQAHCLLKVSNDYEAILAWLRSKRGLDPQQKAHLEARRRHRALGVAQKLDWLQSLSHTQRAYRKEVERFLLWAILQRGRALSSITREDCIAYGEFVADPQPHARWCGTRNRERWSPLWRPFEGPLSASGRRRALTVLRNFYDFLADHQYLMGNPWSPQAMPVASEPMVNAQRCLTVAQWEFAKGQLAALPNTSTNARARFALMLLYATGLRLSEVVAAKVDDLQAVDYPADEDGAALQGWLLTVVGKGAKQRQVPVPTELVTELATYLRHRGLDPNPKHIGNKGAHLLGLASDLAHRAPGLQTGLHSAGEFDPRLGVAVGTLANQLKDFFRSCGSLLRQQGDLQDADLFARASTHWLRHSHAYHAIAHGMPIEIAQQNLGHASLATTSRYATPGVKRRLQAVKGFWGEK